MSKRRIALLRSTKRIPEAIAALTKFLEASPTDAEAWAELADLYTGQGMLPQAIFALEEVLLIAPNAWNVSIPAILLLETELTLCYRSMLDWGKCCTWLRQQVMWVGQKGTLQTRSEGFAGVLSFVMIIFAAIMG